MKKYLLLTLLIFSFAVQVHAVGKNHIALENRAWKNIYVALLWIDSQHNCIQVIAGWQYLRTNQKVDYYVKSRRMGTQLYQRAGQIVVANHEIPKTTGGVSGAYKKLRSGRLPLPFSGFAGEHCNARLANMFRALDGRMGQHWRFNYSNVQNINVIAFDIDRRTAAVKINLYDGRMNIESWYW